MLWILQNNLYNERGYGELIEILNRLDLPILFVKPVPFTDKVISADLDPSQFDDINLAPDVPDPVEPAIVMGTYTLAKIAHKRGWKPGSFLDNLNYEIWSRQWGDLVLNPTAQVCRFAYVSIINSKFIRPTEDSKSFAGKVFSVDDWINWSGSVLAAATDSDPLNANTEVMVYDPVEIHTETRIWVVNGKIATYSQYKRGSTVHYSPTVDLEVLEFAERVLDMWYPNKAFVLDVAQTPLGCRVVEVNCLNAAGFYAGDMGKLVAALEGILEAEVIV